MIGWEALPPIGVGGLFGGKASHGEGLWAVSCQPCPQVRWVGVAEQEPVACRSGHWVVGQLNLILIRVGRTIWGRAGWGEGLQVIGQPALSPIGVGWQSGEGPARGRGCRPIVMGWADGGFWPAGLALDQSGRVRLGVGQQRGGAMRLATSSTP